MELSNRLTISFLRPTQTRDVSRRSFHHGSFHKQSLCVYICLVFRYIKPVTIGIPVMAAVLVHHLPAYTYKRNVTYG
jgi:hypothetical protein